ncbi:hypothetical protein HPB50_011170 [Hyalomma asiaticum]|uniref:Uncharacterized protein n=1 Tax=Hyalomma asiaticum TaxID=266040 RepID=A0ACB7T3T4_HYAAI|nr:hypothetical protein HPB50_011170 [Hyalomma asiaticum]
MVIVSCVLAAARKPRALKSTASKHEQPRERSVPRWIVATKRRYGLFLAVVGVTALAAATLFAFAGMAQQHEEPEEGMDVIKKAFEENSNEEPRPESSEGTRASLSPRFPPCATEPSDESYVAPSASPNLNLLCRFSARYRTGVYPYGVCTHFIYASVPNRAGSGASPRDKDVLYSYDLAAFKKFLHLRDLAADVRLLLSVELEAMLHTGWSPKRLASDARVWLDRSGVDGLHLDGLDILPRSVHNVSEIVTALRKSFKRQYLLTVGIDRTQKIVEDDLLKLLELVDFASFSTSHVRRTDERTTLSNPYSKYENSTSGQFLSREVDKLAKLAARSEKSQVCFTLTLGGNQFQLRDSSEHGLGAPARHVKDVSYSEICKRQWSEVKYIESAIGFYAHSGKTWVGYDTEKTIAAKVVLIISIFSILLVHKCCAVQLALRKYPDFCVMLVHVDKDDVRGTCSEKHFPLVQSVKHAMRRYHRRAPALES